MAKSPEEFKSEEKIQEGISEYKERKEEKEQKERPKFEIGRWGPHEFEVYNTAKTEEEAKMKYQEMVKSLSNPSEIRIFEVGGGQPRKDLESSALPKVEMDPEKITLEDKIDMDTANELGFTLMRGTIWYDYLGRPMSLDEMAEMEASSMLYAEERNLQTSVDPSTGMYVAWKDPDSKLAKQYDERVQKYLKERRKSK